MLTARRPRARRRKRRRPLRWAESAGRGWRRGHEEGAPRRQAPAGKGSLRGSEARAWPLGRAERRSGEHRRCRGGPTGEGPGRGAFSPPHSVSFVPLLSPSPRLSTRFLRQTPLSPPRRLGRRNHPRAAKTEEEALAAAAAASNMADASRAAQLGDRRRRSARPLATGPCGPGWQRATIEQTRARASPPGGRGPLGRGACASPPPRARPLGWPVEPLGPPSDATAKRCAKKSVNILSATSSGNNVHVSVVSVWIGPFTRAAGFSCLLNFTGQ